MKSILIIGAAGSGKTWVVSQLLSRGKWVQKKIGLYRFVESAEMIIVGVYDGSVFQGSDKLSMAVTKDTDDFLFYCLNQNKPVIMEGHRMTNKVIKAKMQPIIIRITDDGEKGRRLRRSQQTDRHIRSIATMVSNYGSTYDVSNSDECLTLVESLVNGSPDKQPQTQAH